MIGGEVKLGGDLGAFGPGADQPGLAAIPECQSQRIQQNGFAGTCFTSQYAEGTMKDEIEALDKDDVADRESGQHGGLEQCVPGPAEPAGALWLVKACSHVLAGEHLIRIDIPFAARKVVAQHRGGLAGLLGQAKRKIAFR